jgi:hypothetical protein
MAIDGLEVLGIKTCRDIGTGWGADEIWKLEDSPYRHTFLLDCLAAVLSVSDISSYRIFDAKIRTELY